MSTDNAPHPMPHPAALSARQAADILGVHEKTVRRWIDRGTLPAVKDEAGAYRIAPEDVEKRRAAGAADSAADTPRGHAARAANMPQEQAASAANMASDRAAPYAAPSIDLRPLADVIERQGEEIKRLTEAATIWQYRARQLEEQVKQLTAGPIPNDVHDDDQPAPESPQTHDIAPGATIAPSPGNESNSDPASVQKSGFARWWAWITGS
jgi:excisionase family DNA binding protein